MEQPLTPPEDDTCEECGRACANRICRDCINDHNRTDNDD